MRRRGFTLLEIVIVVAIIAILASIGLAGISRHADKTRVQTAARDMAQRIAEARSIAEAAGARIGTPRLIIDVSCPASAQPEIKVLIDPVANSYVVPAMINYDSTTDEMTVFCRTYDVGAAPIFSETRQLGALATPSGAQVEISFAATGRVRRPATPDTPVDWHFSINKLNDPSEKYGYRILPSGIVCRSTFTAQVRCNEDF